MIIKKHSLLIIALTLNLHNGLLISADPAQKRSSRIKNAACRTLALAGGCMGGERAQKLCEKHPIWHSVMDVNLRDLILHLNRSAIERLIFGEVDVNERNPEDPSYPLSTPLHIATEAQHAYSFPLADVRNLRICNQLLKKGADIHTLVDEKGKTVFDKIIEHARSILQPEREFGKQLVFICQSNGLMTLTMYDAAKQNGIDFSDRAVSAYLCRPDNNIARLLSGTPHGRPVNQLGNDLSREVSTFLTEPSRIVVIAEEEHKD